jgi:hypothetical protein
VLGQQHAAPQGHALAGHRGGDQLVVVVEVQHRLGLHVGQIQLLQPVDRSSHGPASNRRR